MCIRDRHRYCIFLFIKMAAGVILDFGNHEILLANWVRRVETYAKFHQNWSIRWEDIRFLVFFQDGVCPLLGFWFRHILTKHEVYLMISITVQNLVKVDAIVWCDNISISLFGAFDWKTPIHSPKIHSGRSHRRNHLSQIFSNRLRDVDSVESKMDYSRWLGPSLLTQGRSCKIGLSLQHRYWLILAWQAQVEVTRRSISCRAFYHPCFCNNGAFLTYPCHVGDSVELYLPPLFPAILNTASAVLWNYKL